VRKKNNNNNGYDVLIRFVKTVSHNLRRNPVPCRLPGMWTKQTRDIVCAPRNCILRTQNVQLVCIVNVNSFTNSCPLPKSRKRRARDTISVPNASGLNITLPPSLCNRPPRNYAYRTVSLFGEVSVAFNTFVNVHRVRYAFIPPYLNTRKLSCRRAYFRPRYQ